MVFAICYNAIQKNRFWVWKNILMILRIYYKEPFVQWMLKVIRGTIDDLYFYDVKNVHTPKTSWMEGNTVQNLPPN